MGIIGLGSQGIGHLRNRMGEEALQIVAICDVDQERLKLGSEMLKEGYADRAASTGWKETGDFREILADSGVDAVLCALPDHWHAVPVIMAAEAGKDIYTEKPFSLTVPEGRAMVQAVERSGVVCQVGSQQRSSGSFRRVAELVRNGVLGKIKRVQVGLPGKYDVPQLTVPMAAQDVPDTLDYEMWLGPAPWVPYYKERCRTNFRYIYDYSGGSLTDWIGHHFDIVNWVLELDQTGPVAIRNAQAVMWDGPLYNTAKKYSFEAQYADGTVIEVANQDEDGHYALGDLFDNTDGGIAIEGENGWLKVGRAQTAFSAPWMRNVSLPSDGSRLDFNGNGHMDNFIHCVRTRKTPRCSAEQGHRTATVAHLANLAFRTGRSELRWDPESECVVDAPDAERLLARAYRGPWNLRS